MTKVLAAIDNSAAAKPVLATAARIASLYEADVEAVHVRQNGDRTVRAAADAAGLSLHMLTHSVVGALVQAGRDEEVEAMVVGARGTHAGRRPAGHVALRLIVSLDKPVIVVPPETRPAPDLHRVLVPLDGTRETAAALDRVIRLARRHDLEVVVLHVRGDDSLPRFDDQPQHEADAWSEEFLARYCPDCDVRLEQRVGIPGEHVLNVAEKTGADLIALGWSRDLSPGRAQVVREALDRSRVPILLVGVQAD